MMTILGLDLIRWDRALLRGKMRVISTANYSPLAYVWSV